MEAAIDEKFRFRQNTGKTNTEIFKNLWKTLFFGHFGPIFLIFGTINVSFKSLALSRITSRWSLPTYQFFKKSNDRILRKHLDGRTYRRTDGLMDRTDL